jgi:hypothetical protein
MMRTFKTEPGKPMSAGQKNLHKQVFPGQVVINQPFILFEQQVANDLGMSLYEFRRDMPIQWRAFELACAQINAMKETLRHYNDIMERERKKIGISDDGNLVADMSGQLKRAGADNNG